MKKILCLILAFALCLLTSCKKASPQYSGEGIKITYTETEAEKTPAAESSAASSSAATASTASTAEPYYANMSSKKFHKASCASAKKLKAENIYICQSREQLIAEGYEPCGRCKP